MKEISCGVSLVWMWCDVILHTETDLSLKNLLYSLIRGTVRTILLIHRRLHNLDCRKWAEKKEGMTFSFFVLLGSSRFQAAVLRFILQNWYRSVTNIIRMLRVNNENVSVKQAEWLSLIYWCSCSCFAVSILSFVRSSWMLYDSAQDDGSDSVMTDILANFHSW